MTVHESRVTLVRDSDARKAGKYVLYWMQQSQRAEDNAALDFALFEARRLGLPLVVLFVVADAFPDANARHYAFMLEGLAQTGRAIEGLGARFVMRRGDVPATVAGLARNAAVLVCDRGYTRVQRRWRADVCAQAGCRVFEVEADAVVPVGLASGKAQYMARTLRPRILALRDVMLVHDEIPPRARARLGAFAFGP